MKLLVSSWLVVGIVASLAGFLGWYSTPIAIVLILPLFALELILTDELRKLSLTTRFERVLIGLLIGTWLLHALGLFVPETGFDAVWYHLPLVQLMVDHHRFVYDPALYQSANPLFTDAIFGLGYLVAGETGAKIIAYGFGLSLIYVTYILARRFLSRQWALMLILTVSSIQVVAWQSSSFYIDVAKAFWEVTAIWWMIRAFASTNTNQQLVASGLSLGASVGSKLFSVALIPIFWLMIAIQTQKKALQYVLLFTLGVILIALPFYLRTYHHSQFALIGGGFFLDTVPDIGGQEQLIAYVLQRTMSMQLSPFALIMARDYISILLIVCLPIFIWHFPRLWENVTTRSLLFFAGSQYLLWWYLPPSSTRYALAGFIVLLLLYFVSIHDWVVRRIEYTKPLIITILLAFMLNMAPRAVVGWRNIEYLVTRPSLTEYVARFYDGSIDRHLQQWYDLE